ncbi:hypothetical protein KPL78_25920 [Roseomonas sp. HJA6]|uniref:HTH araC/xylS-type domain-containing protein n=1 Tax=Roseomonas alba TaxID=2846776 RepID=A0ABS7AGC9_9PROT|nr:hypothetical protein [Neoroseomonas alba]MBW6401321.1 hypothetical protein [Neoroseomonas alba]
MQTICTTPRLSEAEQIRPLPATVAEQSNHDDPPDLAITHFVRAILPEEQAEEILHGFYTDAFHRAVMECRSMLRTQPRLRSGQRLSPLPRWKLRKALIHVDENIGGRIRLGDVASHVGLSAMHFAAQFRLATGQRLHDYVTPRRLSSTTAPGQTWLINTALGTRRPLAPTRMLRILKARLPKGETVPLLPNSRRTVSIAHPR